MRWITRSIIPVAVALAALVSFLPRSGPTIELTMRDFRFVPQVLTVNAGDSVAIVNEGKATHTFDCPGPRGQAGGGCGVAPGDVQPGMTEVVKFARAGTYEFVCRYHSARGMGGQLVVRGGGSDVPAPAPSPTGPAGASPTGPAGASPTGPAGAPSP